MINPDLLNQLDIYAEQFISAPHFKHVVIDNFLEKSICDALAVQFPLPDFSKMKNEFGKPSRKHQVSEVRKIGSEYEKLDNYIKSSQFLSVMEKITGIDSLIYDPKYFGGGTHNNLTGQGMNPHVDFNMLDIEGVGQTHRRLNAIIYLNTEWKEEWHGNLELHANPWDPDSDDIKTIVPIYNRLVLFETNEYSWHGFKSVSKAIPDGTTRKSFAIYLYTLDRPVDKIAPKHATVYVPQIAIDEGLFHQNSKKEGRQAVRAIRTEVLAMMKGLYNKEKYLNAIITRQKNTISSWKESQIIPVYGRARQHGRVVGFDYDLVMQKKCNIFLRALSNLSKINIKISSLNYMDGQSVSIYINDKPAVLNNIIDGVVVFDVDVEVFDGSDIEINFEFMKAYSAESVGVGKDLRESAGRFFSISVL